MNKWTEYQRGRDDGLQLALKIIKKDGIQGLERELEYRRITGLNTSLAARDLEKSADKIKEMAMDTMSILGVAALHDAFGFGKSRCMKFLDRMAEGSELVKKNMATWQDYIDGIKEELDLDLEIRWND